MSRRTSSPSRRPGTLFVRSVSMAFYCRGIASFTLTWGSGRKPWYRRLAMGLPYGVPVGLALTGLDPRLSPSRWSWEGGGMARSLSTAGRER
jgi:hypothetical protein